MTRKILSITLAVLMMFSVFSVLANAAPNTEITFISIKDVVAPVDGAKPTYTYKNNGDYYHFCDEYESDVVKNCMEWYDITAQKSVKPTDTFQGGHQYTVTFYLIADDGYIFPEIVNDVAVNGIPSQGSFINNNEIGHSFRYQVICTFPVVEKTVKSIAVTGVTAPSIGAKPAYKATVASDAEYTVTSAYDSGNIKNGVVWYDVTAQKEVKSTDTFQTGHSYCATVYLRAKEDYAFSRIFAGSVTLNGNAAQGEPADKETFAAYVQDYTVVYTFPALGQATTKIASVTVTGVKEPKADQSPIFNATINANANYEAYQKSLITAVKWFDVTDNKTINSVDTFKAGHTYRFTIKLQAKENCEFKVDSSNALQVTGKVNSYSAKVSKSGSLDPKQVIELSYEFKLDGEPDISFPDVKKGDWYYDVVQYVAKKGYIKGYQNGKFGPNDSLKRQDFVCILARIDGADLSYYENQTSKLTDVKKGDYYAAAVNWAVAHGYISGYKNGKFGVNDPITREQVATILYNYMGSPIVENVDETLAKFSDGKKVSTFAVIPMAWAVQNGIISGMGNGTISSTSGATRAQIAAIIQRMDSKGMFIKY